MAFIQYDSWRMDVKIMYSYFSSRRKIRSEYNTSNLLQQLLPLGLLDDQLQVPGVQQVVFQLCRPVSAVTWTNKKICFSCSRTILVKLYNFTLNGCVLIPTDPDWVDEAFFPPKKVSQSVIRINVLYSANNWLVCRCLWIQGHAAKGNEAD